MELLLATTNLHKIREFKDIFKTFSHLEILTLHHFPQYVAPEETGKTFKDNAIQKAVHAAQYFNKWAIADDSGLVVPALKGQPGVFSRRYAGPEATDADNLHKLLQDMQNLSSQEERVAYYECSLAIASPAGLQKCVQGLCEGFLLTAPRGRNGFGYDPVFVKNDYEKTFAELDESLKNRISHRRKAFDRLSIFLENLRD